MPRLPLFLVASLLLPVADRPLRAADPAPARTPITATDLLRIKQLETPALSPDGRWVAYVVRSIEPKPDDPSDWIYRSHLWLAATDGSSPPRQLTQSANNTAPAWSPAGDRIAFVRTIEKEKPQVWILPMDAGEPWALTRLETGAANPAWSPDGSRLAFTSTLSYGEMRAALAQAGRESAPPWSTERPARKANDTSNRAAKPAAKMSAGEKAALPPADPEGDGAARREWLAQNEADANPRVTSRLNLLGETDLQPVESIGQLYLVEVRQNAEPRPIAPGFEAVGIAPRFTGGPGFAWLPDGRHLACLAPRDPMLHPDRQLYRNLCLLDIETGAVRVLLDRPEENYADPTPSPDGKWIAYTVRRGDPVTSFDQASVAVIPAHGGEPRVLSAQLDRSAQDLRWNPRVPAIHFTVARNGRFPMYRVPLPDGELQALTWQADWGIQDFDVSEDILAQVVTSPENPFELHVGTRDGKTARRLTSHNQDWIAGRTLAAYEQASFTNTKGLKVDYWVIKPPGFDPARKYPLLLQIHGGPAAMWGPGEASMWHEFQYYAARGYVVVFANPRGSGGYGRDFERANYQDWGAGPTSDVLAAVDAVAREPWIDRERLAVTGGSYAGYLTAWIVAHDHRFKAAVAQRGVYDLGTFFGEGTAWRLVPRYFGGPPWEPATRRILERESPLTHVANIRTPLLIQHGDVDFRTGVIQSQMLYKSLKALERPVEYVRYPRASHEMSRSGEPKQRLDSLVRYDEFMRRHLGGD